MYPITPILLTHYSSLHLSITPLTTYIVGVAITTGKFMALLTLRALMATGERAIVLSVLGSRAKFEVVVSQKKGTPI